MRAYELVHELINKFVPMDALTKTQLKNDAASFYAQTVAEQEAIFNQNKEAVIYNENAKDEPYFKPTPLRKITIKHKIVNICETWWMRYVFAILFVIAVPKIKSYINGDNDEESENEDSGSELEEFMEFKRFKNSQK